MFPAYSVAQNDKQKLQKLYLRIVKISVLVIYLPMSILLVNAHDFIAVFFGEKWIGATVAVQFMTIAAMIKTISNSQSALFQGMGKVGLQFRLQMFRAIAIFAPALYIGIKYYGIEGAAGAVAVQQLIDLPITSYFIHKTTGLKVMRLVKEFLPDMLASIFAICCGFCIAQFMESGLVSISVISIAMVVVYFLVLYLVMGRKLVELFNSLYGMARKI